MPSCPHCKLPLSRKELSLACCPVCKKTLDAKATPGAARLPDASSAQMMPEAVAPGAKSGSWLAWGVPLIIVLACGGLCVTLFIGDSMPQKRPAASAPIATAAPLAVATTKQTSQPIVVQQVAASQPAATVPAVAVAAKPDTPASVDAADATEPTDSPEVKNATITKIDKPDGEYVVDALNAGKIVRLSGKVKKLTVGPMDGGSRLDAAALEVQDVVFTGPINGKSYVKVRASGGSIEFRGEISGQSTVWAYATEGKVSFGSPSNRAASAVNGDSRIHITAREVLFWGTVNGGSTNIITRLTKGGKLLFTELTGGVRLSCRKVAKSDPELVIEQGKIGDQAKFERQN